MNFKKMMLITLLLLAFITIGTVSAEDTSDNLAVVEGDVQTIDTPDDNNDLLAKETGESNENNGNDEPISHSDNENMLSTDDVVVNFTDDNLNVSYGASRNITVELTGGTIKNITVLDDNNTEITNITTYKDKIITISNLSTGKYTLKINTVSNNTSYNNSTVMRNFTVNPACSDIKFDGNLSYDYGNEGYINIIVVNGTVNKNTISVWDKTSKINNANIIFIPANSNSSCRIKISNLTVGNYTLNVTSITDKNHTNTTKTINFTVNIGKATVIIMDDKLDFINETSGNITLNVNNGNIAKENIWISHKTNKVSEANITYDNKTGIISVSNLTVGDYTLNIYLPALNGNYTNITFTRNFTVYDKLLDPDFNITISAGKADENVNITITANNKFKDTVTVKLDNTHNITVYIVNGTGFNATKLNAGNYNASLTFNGNYLFNSSSISNKTFTVKNVLIDPNLNITVSNVTYGSQTTVVITTNNTFSGTVNVTLKKNNNVIQTKLVTINNGQGTETFNNLAAGTYIVEAVLSETGVFNKSSKNKSFKVDKAPINLEINVPLQVNVGANVTITINANPSYKGNINLTINGTPYVVAVDNGKGTETLSFNTTGKYNIICEFKENENFTTSTVNKIIEVTNNTVKYNLSLVITANDVDLGKNITINIKTNTTFNGNITVNFNNKDYNVTVKNGTGTLSLKPTKTGKYTITAKFNGTDIFNATNATKNVYVRVDPSLEVTVAASAIYGNSFKITVKTNTTFTGKLTVTIDKKTYTVNVKKGSGTLTIKDRFAVGKHEIKVTFAKNDKFKKSTKSAKIKITNRINMVLKKVTVKKSAKKLVLQVTLKKINYKKPAKKTRKIIFRFNGKKYTVKTKKTVVKLTIKENVLKNLKVGKKVTYKATYSTKTVTKTVKVKQ